MKKKTFYPKDKYPFNVAIRIDDLGIWNKHGARLFGCMGHNPGALYPWYSRVVVWPDGHITSDGR